MNTKSKSNNSVIGILIVIVVAGIGYFIFKSPSNVDNGGLLQADSSSMQASADSARILNLLNQIEGLRIDTSIFQSAAYQTLVDYSVPIPQLNVGRPNPFAPLPGVPASAGTGNN